MLSKKIKEKLENLITLKDVQEILGVNNRMTIHRMRVSKGLDEIQILIPGNDLPAVRFFLEDLIKWADKNEIGTPGLKKWMKRNKREL